MKRLALLLVGLAFVTGCSTSQNAQPSNAANTANTAVTNQTATSNAGNTTNSATSTPTVDPQLKTAAYGLIERYILSHNDKTLPEYKVDTQQLFIPGLAAAIGSSASKGVDYAHPVSSYKIQIQQTAQMNDQQFKAIADVTIQYKGEAPQQKTYHLWCMQKNQQWYIASIG